MEEINVMELLDKAYEKYANAAINNRWNVMTMHGSGLKFRIHESLNDQEHYKWMLEFNVTIEYSGRSNFRIYYFKSDKELGKFLFDAGTNGGIPKGGKIGKTGIGEYKKYDL